MTNSFLVLIPPFLVLALAFYTRRIITSLTIGIVISALMSTNFQIKPAINIIFKLIKNKVSDIDNFYTFAFLILLGITLAIITKTGGAIALGDVFTKKLKNKKDAQSTSLVLSLLLAIDDYLNALTSGFVMRPITDRFKIPRVKLSFLVNSMTAPITILIPFSSWAGMILRQFAEAGISLQPSENPIFNGDPLFIYLKTIPFIFYSILMIFSAWFIVRKNISFGLIKKHEDIAEKTGDLQGGKNVVLSNENIKVSNPSLLDFIAPMTVLVVGFLGGVLYSGDVWFFGGGNSVIIAFQSSNVFAVLFYVSIFTTLTAYFLAIFRNKIKLNETFNLAKEGWNLTFSAILLIFSAWIFSDILGEYLLVGKYLAGILIKNVAPSFLPLLMFASTTLVSIVIGSAWGTISLMLPLATEIVSQFSGMPIPMDPKSACYLLPTLAAVLSGAIAGNHMSPIGDVSIMSSTSCGSNHLEHVKGQFTYAIIVFISTCISYLLSGFIVCQNKILSLLLPLTLGTTISFATFYVVNKLSKKNEKNITA